MNFLLAPVLFIVWASAVSCDWRIQWIPASEVDLALLEIGGREDHETAHTDTYVVRAPHLDGIISGKYAEYSGTAYFPYNGNELQLQDYEFLSFPRGTLSWIPTTNLSSTIENMVVGGIHPGTLETTFLCRAWKDVPDAVDLVLGKLLPSTGICYIPVYQGEYRNTEYEVLAINAYGIATNLTVG